jgi:hypothetical protein
VRRVARDFEFLAATSRVNRAHRRGHGRDGEGASRVLVGRGRESANVRIVRESGLFGQNPILGRTTELAAMTALDRPARERRPR